MEKLNEYIKSKEKYLSSNSQLSSSKFKDINLAGPFTDEGYRLARLLGNGIITLTEYENVILKFFIRHPNMYLYEYTSKAFGSTWAEKHVKECSPVLVKPTRKLDDFYQKQNYDLLLIDGDRKVRIEVKASRAVDKRQPKKKLAERALKYNADYKYDAELLMNFQQLKPANCHVFVWVAVWDDRITYWVLSSDEVANNPYSSPQHANSVNEWQIMINNDNIDKFKQFEVLDKNDLLAAIKRKAGLL